MRVHFQLIFLIVVLAACSSGQYSSQPFSTTQPSQTMSVNTQPSPTITSTPSPTPTSTPTPTASPTPLGGSIPQIAHFFLAANAQKPEEQGVFLAHPGVEANPKKLLSMSDVGIWYPLLKFSPDGTWLLVAPNYPKDEPAAQTKTLDVINTTSGEVSALSSLNSNVYVEQIEWSPDGQWLMVMYYFFGKTADNIDLYNFSSGEKISVGQGVFIGWLPDSTGVIIQLNTSIDLFSMETRQKKPYLSISILSRRLGMTKLAVLPEHDALLMRDGENLVFIPGLANLVEPARLDFDEIQKNMLTLGKIPPMGYNSLPLISPTKDRLLITNKVNNLENNYSTYIYNLDGSMEVSEYPNLLAVAWSPDGQAFLGIQFKQVPYKGRFSVSRDPYEAIYVIQPIDGATKPVVIYNLPPTCGLLSESSSDGRTFNQRRAMLSCINYPNTQQDAIWK